MKRIFNMKFNFKKAARMLLIVAAVFFSIGFMEKKQGGRECKKILIQVENTFENYFIDEKDIFRLVTKNGARKVVGMSLSQIDMKQIEKEVLGHHYVKDAQVYRDLKGNLIVNVKQRRPIARIVQPDGPDAYIGEEGEILPLSDIFSARTIILHGPYTAKFISEGLDKSNHGLKLLAMLKFIERDAFLRAEIAEIAFDRHGAMTFYLQVGKQEIIFGSADDYESKFSKLNIFMDKILPLKGWNYYSTVNLKFKDQIICE